MTTITQASYIAASRGAAYWLQQLCDEGYDWIYCGDDDDPPKTPDTENSPANGTSASVARLMSGS